MKPAQQPPLEEIEKNLALNPNADIFGMAQEFVRWFVDLARHVEKIDPTFQLKPDTLAKQVPTEITDCIRCVLGINGERHEYRRETRRLARNILRAWLGSIGAAPDNVSGRALMHQYETASRAPMAQSADSGAEDIDSIALEAARKVMALRHSDPCQLQAATQCIVIDALKQVTASKQEAN